MSDEKNNDLLPDEVEISFEDEKKHQDQLFNPVPIDDFLGGKQITFPVFVRLSANKFVRLAYSGQELSKERLGNYAAKGVKFLYIKKKDYRAYAIINAGISKAILHPKVTLPKEKKVRLMRHALEVISRETFVENVNKEKFSLASEVVENSLEIITTSGEIAGVLASLLSQGQYLLAHSLGVAMYSTMLAKELKWFAGGTLFKLSTGGFFHDIGLTRLPKKLIEKPDSIKTSEDNFAYENHVELGYEILKSLDGIPDAVMTITYQHHEHENGSGYPQQLPGYKIFPLAKVAAIADGFCNLALRHPAKPRMSGKNALGKMLTVDKHLYDNEMLRAFATMFIKGSSGKSMGRSA